MPDRAHAEVPLVAETDLKPGALRLPGILMQSVATIAPAFGIVLILQVVASYAGLTVPLAFVFITLILIFMAVALGDLARKLPAAGAFYTYASCALHPRAGFMTGWLYMIALPLAPGFLVAFFAETLDSVLQADFGVHIPWWATFLVVTAFVSIIVYRGIELSARNLLLFGGLEMLIMVALAIWALAQPGPGGFSLQPFDPSRSTSTHGLYLAVVFSLFAMIGWEEAAPLAEETENPHRNIPLAMIGSICLTGLLFVFCTWAVIVGFGTDHVSALANASNPPPALTIAQRYWGDAGTVVILLALLNSTIAVAISSCNAATRMMYGMGESGALPRWLGKVHPVLKTPVNAVITEIVLTFATALVFGFAMGPVNYFNTFGLMDTLGIGLVLTIVMAGVTAYFLREQREQFNFVKHLLLPLIGAAAMIWVIYNSIIPLPPAPVEWAIPAVAGWIIIGIAILIVRKLRGREDWLLAAVQAPEERPETPAELAERPNPLEF
jgi:amino acid transporter